MNEQQLPSLPEPYKPEMLATSSNTESVHKGFEMGGYVKTQALFTADQMQAYARAALAMSPKATSGTSEQQERSAFEAELFGMYEFYSDRPHFERYTDGDYIDSRTHKFWRIWQARAALAANVPQYADLDGLAHELWAVAQLPQGQGITDGVERIKAVLLAARGLAANVPAGLCERICAAIKATDDKSMDEAGYMLDSNDCIAIVRAQFAAAPAPEADHFPAAGKLVAVAPAQAQHPDTQDAERYRWLRDEHIGDDPESINLRSGKTRGLDAAIDWQRIGASGEKQG